MPDRVRPITPKEVIERKAQTLPDAVLRCFNTLIIREWDGFHAIVTQDEVMRLMIREGLTRCAILENSWLDIEDAYRAAGWEVLYDKPGDNEDFAAQFIFKKKIK